MLKKLKQKLIYEDAWLKFYQDEIEFPDGSKGTYAWANRMNGVGVLVVTTDNKILLHKEHRYVIQEYSWEMQGGGIDENETPQQAAIRELEEEASIKVTQDQLIPLGAFYPLHSFNTEKVTVFMVIIDRQEVSLDNTESGESIDKQQYFSFDEALEMIDTGKVNDAFAANVIQMAIRKVNQKS